MNAQQALTGPAWPARWQRLGPARWPLLGAAAALLTALLLAAGLAPAWQQDAAQAQAQARTQRAQAAQACRAASAAQAADWRQQLPTAAALDERLAGLLRAALLAGLSVGSIEQRTVPGGSAGIERQQLTLALQGRYEALRGLIEQALQADPALVLEHLRLVRQQADGELLEARLSLVLLQRTGAR